MPERDSGRDETLAAGHAQPTAAPPAPAPEAAPEATLPADSAGATLPADSAGATLPVVVRGADDYPELQTVERRHYVLGREVARGGMGRIVVGRDRRLGRTVAIKELLQPSPGLRARFEREARITARLQHPGIVNLTEAGVWPDGEPFFAMKLVEGVSLDAAVAKRASFRERLELLPAVLAAVDALAYAHDRGVIHRDLKPHNVLVGDYGETVVIDWGLAKEAGEADAPAGPAPGPRSGDATAFGEVMGTPSYMPPEQAAGEPVTARADVYALGALTYHVLAGAPPYRGRTADEVLDQVRAAAPDPLARRVPEVPRDLATIVERAMARDPAARYPTAKELAQDLRRFQTGQMVGAHQYSLRELAARFLRRYRVPVLVGAVALVVLTAVLVITVGRILSETRRANRERDVSETRRIAAQNAEAAALERADALALEQARRTLDDDPARALALLAGLSDRGLGADSHDVALAAVLAVPGRVTTNTPPAPVPADDRVTIQRQKHQVVVAAGGAPRVIVLPAEPGYTAELSPGGDWLAIDLGDTVQLVPTRGGPQVGLPMGKILAVADDGRVAVRTALGGLYLADAGGVRHRWKLADGDFVVSPGWTRVAVSSRFQRGIDVIDFASGVRLHSLRGLEGQFTVRFEGEQRVIAEAIDDTRWTWDLPVAVRRRLPSTSVSVGPAPAGLLAVRDGARWRVETLAGEPLGDLESHKLPRWAPDGSAVAGYGEREVQVYDVRARALVRFAHGDPAGQQAGLAVPGPGAARVAWAGGLARDIHVRDLASAREVVCRLHQGGRPVWSKDGQLVLLPETDELSRCDPATGNLEVVGPGLITGSAAQVAFRDGELVLGDAWKLSAGPPGKLAELATHTDNVRRIEVLEDGTVLAAGGSAITEVAPGKQPRRIDLPGRIATLSRRGRRVLVGLDGGGLALLDLDGGAPLRLRADHVVVGFFAPDGAIAAVTEGEVDGAPSALLELWADPVPREPGAFRAWAGARP